MWRGKIHSMTPPLMAEDLAPLIALLTPQERIRLFFHLVTMPNHSDDTAYQAAPPSHDEFATDDEPLAWDSDGGDGVK